jgi:transcriptional regulator with XRE-family HTH domain
MAKFNKIDVLVGGRVRLRRIQLGIEPASLALTAKIEESRLQAFEAGRERIGAKFLVVFAHALEVPPAFFFQNPIIKDPAPVAVATSGI